MRLRLSKLRIVVVAVRLLLVGLIWLVLRAFPVSEVELRRSACLVDGRVGVCLVCGKDTVELMADSVHQEGVWINRHWWWPSCDGRVLTVGPTSKVMSIDLSTICDSLSDLLHRKETERKELAYYLRSHGVIDEGYTQIAAYATMQNSKTDSLKRQLTVLQKIRATDSADKKSGKAKKAQLTLRGSYRVSWYDGNNKPHSVTCETVTSELTGKAAPLILHTQRSFKPWGVYAVRNVPWGATQHRKIVTVRIIRTKQKAPYHSIIVTGNYWQGHDHDIPSLFAKEGAPVFTQHGRFIGIIHGKEVMQ